ncbi:phage late control D family protein [Streptomyces sp. NPDC059010]|uniref:phage late control D family protein n=1 Tax=Streptomyces sp. NPDC059010 TaxID=3346695 RepID=UPI00369E1C80
MAARTRTPYFAVRVAGQDITPWVGSVQVVEDDRQADNFSLTVNDPRLAYADALIEGCHAEIDLGYAETGQHALMLRALITKVETGYPENGAPTVRLHGEDGSIVMGLDEKNRKFKNTTVTAIVRKVADEHRFGTVETRLVPDPKVVEEHQAGVTDLAFLQDLATRHHAKCFVELDERDREVLYFVPERHIVRLRRPDTLVLRYRMGPDSNLMSFSPAFDTGYVDQVKEINDLDDEGRTVRSPQPPPAEVALWPLPTDLRDRVNAADHARMKALYEAGAKGKEELQRTLLSRRKKVGAVARDQAELDSTGGSLESRRLGMTASGTTVGTIWLRAKSNVEIRGVHTRFAGQWYVSSATHTIDGNGYRTDFRCVR